MYAMTAKMYTFLCLPCFIYFAIPHRKSKKMVNDACLTTGTSTRRGAARTDRSAIERQDIADEAVSVNEQLNGSHMTNEHQFHKAASCTISTNTSDSACIESSGTSLLV